MLAACGHKDDAPAAVTSAATAPVVNNNYVGGRCGDQVTADYLAFNERCRRPRDRDEDFRCRDRAQDFLRKYPGVNCTATAVDSRTNFTRDFQIEAREIQESLGRRR
ncbi:MAG: hypothetical protein ACXVB9_03645 [Bdellovibrionota bacterium]